MLIPSRSVRLSVCLNPKSDQLFCLSCLIIKDPRSGRAKQKKLSPVPRSKSSIIRGWIERKNRRITWYKKKKTRKVISYEHNSWMNCVRIKCFGMSSTFKIRSNKWHLKGEGSGILDPSDRATCGEHSMIWWTDNHIQ